MHPMAQQANSLKIFLRLCPGVRILLGFRAGMKKLRRATFYTVLSKGGFSLGFQAFSQFDNTGCKTGYFFRCCRTA